MYHNLIEIVGKYLHMSRKLWLFEMTSNWEIYHRVVRNYKGMINDIIGKFDKYERSGEKYIGMSLRNVVKLIVVQSKYDKIKVLLKELLDTIGIINTVLMLAAIGFIIVSFKELVQFAADGPPRLIAIAGAAISQPARLSC